MSRPRYLLVTGKLAEPALRRMLERMTPQPEVDFQVAVLPISVAALATTNWIARHIQIPLDIERVILPGLCGGDVSEIQTQTTAKVVRGPNDLRDLPEFLGTANTPGDYGKYDIEILAEINHAPSLSLRQVLDQAAGYRNSGADVIDLGCDPADDWSGVGDAVRALRAEGFRVSIDSFNPDEVDAAVAAGAELVLSVNSTNRIRARSWGCEVVAIPDDPSTMRGLDETVEFLRSAGVRFRIDPVIEPIGFGFAESLGRYLQTRRRYPDAEILMGIGNLTELTDVDSAGVNVLLLGFCQELGVRSVLTTEVINWCRSAVQEIARARRLVYHACRDRVLPKHLAPELVMLRDPKLREHGDDTLRDWATRITDPNFRIFAESGVLHLFNHLAYLRGTEPFQMFKDLQEIQPVDPSHAFYLGFEMAKAVTGLTLGKNYVQDQALSWGLLSVPENSHRGKIPGDVPETED